MADVDQVFSFARFGRRLGTRLEGARAQTELLAALSALPEGGVLVLDLAGVEVFSGSFADEAVAEVLARLKAGELPGRYLYLRTPALELLEDLGAKLHQRQLALLVRRVGQEEWKVLGWLPPHLERVLSYVLRGGEGRSPEVAAGLNLSLAMASGALRKLGELRLLRVEREARPTGGYQLRCRPLA